LAISLPYINHPHAPYNDSRKKHAACPSLSAVHDVDCLKTLNLPNANQGTCSGLTECPGIPRDLFNQWSCLTAADAKPPAAVDTPARMAGVCVCVRVCVRTVGVAPPNSTYCWADPCNGRGCSRRSVGRWWISTSGSRWGGASSGTCTWRVRSRPSTSSRSR
jgi:hypothetical protein